MAISPLFLAFALFASADVSHSDQEIIGKNDPILAHCIETSRETSADYSQCYGAAIKRADDRLNIVYKNLMQNVGGKESEAGKDLLKEQRLWISFKQEACGLYWGSEFGSMHRSIIGPSCILNIVSSRVEQLEDMNSNFETEY
ncbi:hypothetical protein LPB140_09075 [Sphingorhabdus lutea]|uniref:Lysozyme inhibitor LprI-like N-terminal domain-containing protein n=1 Tax=Sphingorhabdus lutea TaxID=1913578 RepID=A0A1L3JCN5_9SPHN|nr:lysozyme inhibitor LprI family protein [Sphingorhabdus lutea]APG62917.1 hypothetical protein LPB140_09075 [Sphingorhabdus lutea]